MAVQRLKSCGNIIALSEELGVHRRLLYKWRDQLEAIEDDQGPPANSRERELRQQDARLKRGIADKTLEADFSKVPCKKGSTPEQNQLWRNCIFDQIEELMPMPGGMGIERMCRLAGVSRASFIAACKNGLRWKRHGGALCDSANRCGASKALRIQKNRGRIAAPWHDSELPTRGSGDARG
jgi:transposase-like protein